MAGNIRQSRSSLLQAMWLPHRPTLISRGSPSLFPPMPVDPSKTKQQTKVVVLWDKFPFLTDHFISWCKDYPDKRHKLFSDSSQAAQWEGRQRVTNNQSKKPSMLRLLQSYSWMNKYQNIVNNSWLIQHLSMSHLSSM